MGISKIHCRLDVFYQAVRGVLACIWIFAPTNAVVGKQFAATLVAFAMFLGYCNVFPYYDPIKNHLVTMSFMECMSHCVDGV
jgi:hypothetical protein